jgi:type I restriction enzyme R subunit
LDELKELVHGEDSDLYDVLSYVAYHSSIVPRKERALRAKLHIGSYSEKQQDFINFILEQYVRDGVKELDDERLGDHLLLKYDAITNAKEVLGSPKEIRELFIGFQGYLYDKNIA